MNDGLRFAFGTLTALPVAVRRWDRKAARAGMLLAPLTGLVLGLVAAAAGGLLSLGTGPLLAAVASVASVAVLTRGLHLDGLADTADGLGSGKPAEQALAVMRRSDIGPFGVLALLFVLLAQIAALSEVQRENGWPAAALALTAALVAGRCTLPLACRPAVPPARPEGLGAAVAGTVPRGRACASAGLAVLALLVPAGLLAGPGAALRTALAMLAGLGAAEALLRHCVRRLGGTTGDVFGALAETAATTCLVLLAVG
ncbi:adenosylcobinamide-GDP ribazoletransferase [Streptomyces polyrhachis]|uniref:Adenosylcobinamide-GDP ribazoletransferase n=1 Tax=Streptomyces polyrhachis TaxID=1282885 RepID=A0ABW2GLC5_9ACTN